MFTWKEGKDIFKGEGIYHITWVVVNRTALLGVLEPLPVPNEYGHKAWVKATPLGRAVLRKFTELDQRHPQLQIIHKELMPNHLHAVVWMRDGFEGSIKMIARGFAQGCSKIAREMAVNGAGTAQCDCAHDKNTPAAPANALAIPTNAPAAPASALAIPTNTPAAPASTQAIPTNTPAASASTLAIPTNAPASPASTPIEVSLSVQSHCTNTFHCANASSAPIDPLDCGNGAHTLFSTPFIRTLAHKGQLQSMIDYNRANPDNAWLRRLHPDLYTIRRRVKHGDLYFDTMGKSRLLDYPDRQVIALSRSLTTEQIEAEVRKALYGAETGKITLTAAINQGEKAVARAVREAGYPLVIMMLEGFPKEGTETARFFHPNGIYHRLCGEGLLYLMAPLAENYANPLLIAATEQELRRKAEQKHLEYRPIPHTTTRWRMMAGNVMLGMV